MSGARPCRRLMSGARPDRRFRAPAGISYRPCGTPPCRARSRLRIHNNKTADPVHGSSATSIAAAGMPPEPHEREAVIAARPRPLGSRADRMAPYKVIRHAGPHARCAAPFSERDARLRHVEGSDVPHAMSDRTRDTASQPARAVHGRPRLEQRVKESHRGERAADRSAGPGACWRAGLRSSRGSAHAPDRTPTVRPDSRDFGPTARPARAADEGDAASVRGDLAGIRRPYLDAAFASARFSIALSF